jgi:hypothetical protein
MLMLMKCNALKEAKHLRCYSGNPSIKSRHTITKLPEVQVMAKAALGSLCVLTWLAGR